jgi:uncharacterized membrane protein (DUF2068 family)
MHQPHLHGPRTLALIAAFKFVKAVLLIVLAIALLRLRHPDAITHLVAWLGALPFASGHEFVSRMIGWLLGMNTHTLSVLVGIALAYAALYMVEGVGLWWNVEWAKYLTAISTSLFIPIELWQIVVRFAPVKLLALAINVAIVVYLVHMLRADIAEARRHRTALASDSPTVPR